MSNYKLSISSKKLGSGKCQIKFTILSKDVKLMYGYMLSEADCTLKEVVSRIEERVKVSNNPDQLYHSHLYDLTSRSRKQEIMLFKN